MFRIYSEQHISKNIEYFLGKLHVCKIIRYFQPGKSVVMNVLCSLVNVRELSLVDLLFGFQEYQALGDLIYLEKLQLRSVIFRDGEDDCCSSSQLKKFQHLLCLELDGCRIINAHYNNLYDYLFYGLDNLHTLVVIDNGISLKTAQTLIAHCSQLQTIILDSGSCSVVQLPSLLSRLPNFRYFICSKEVQIVVQIDDNATDGGAIFTRMTLEECNLLLPCISASFWNRCIGFSKKNTLK